VPDIARKNQVFKYAGQTNWTNPVDPSSGNMNYPTEMAMAVDAVGPSWATVKVQAVSVLAGVPQKSEMNLMAGSFSLPFIHPQVLAQLRPNTLLDEDPTTKIKMAVTDVRQGTVTIVSEGPGSAASATYDANTGVLIDLTTRTPSSGTTTRVQLQR
jgi:hypothetical protein